jgi:hypothetical protein
MVDRVTLKGSEEPIRIYTIDLVSDEFAKPKKALLNKLEIHMEHKLEKEKISDSYGIDNGTVVFTEMRPDLKPMIYRNNRFLTSYNSGMSSYILGEWIKAMSFLRKALSERPNDGPAIAILSYMKTFDYICPSDWPGYRVLTEK